MRYIALLALVICNIWSAEDKPKTYEEHVEKVCTWKYVPSAPLRDDDYDDNQPLQSTHNNLHISQRLANGQTIKQSFERQQAYKLEYSQVSN